MRSEDDPLQSFPVGRWNLEAGAWSGPRTHPARQTKSGTYVSYIPSAGAERTREYLP